MATSEIIRKRSALQREQARLQARLAEIDEELAALELAEEVQDVLDHTPHTQGGRGGKAKRSHGGHWVEVRLVNGCGPYAYERWWDGNVKRSKYLGKAITKGATK